MIVKPKNIQKFNLQMDILHDAYIDLDDSYLVEIIQDYGYKISDVETQSVDSIYVKNHTLDAEALDQNEVTRITFQMQGNHIPDNIELNQMQDTIIDLLPYEILQVII